MNKTITTGLLILLLTTGARAQYCNLSGQTPYAPQQPGITNFSLNTINRTSGNSESFSSVLVVTGMSTTVTPGQTYTISMTHSEDSQNFPGARNNLRVWVDYNQNFSFTDPGETVLLKDLHAPNTTYTSTFTIPMTATGTLALRATAKMSNDAGHTIPTPCNVPADPLGYHGEMEDYLLIVDAGVQGSAPQAQFSTSASTLCTTGTMSLTNASTGTPTPTYSWTANPSAGVTFSPSSSSQNPTVKFTNAGNYTITCVATNSLGSNAATKTATLVACSSVGIAESVSYQMATIFPNPASDVIHIKNNSGSPVSIVIISGLGDIIMEKSVAAHEAQLDVSGLSAGIYHLQIRNETAVIHQNLIITR